jgi:hypothetical protein
MPVPPVIRPPLPQFPSALRLYLEISDTQIETIRNLNADFQRFASGKYLRMSQLQQEIAQDTASEPLDPMKLGLSYAEMETIRRQLQQELVTTRSRIRQTLTDPQRAKLKTLEDAARLIPIYSEAISVNLLEPYAYNYAVGGVIGGIIGGTLPGVTRAAEPLLPEP